MINKILLILFFVIELFAQNLDSIQSQIDQSNRILSQKKQEFLEEKSKYPLFLIYGEIKDREENILQIWGTALPVDNDYSSPGTVEENNIIVVNPEKDKIIYNNYTGGKHYYLYKGVSKNAFNANVPVRYYGELPTDAKNNINSLSEEINILERKIEFLSEDYNKVQLNILINQAKDKLNKNKNDESISLLQKAIKISETNKEINQLLFENYLYLAQIDSLKGNYLESLTNINIAIQLKNLTSHQYATLKKYHFNLCSKIADDYFRKKDYPDAISYYSQSLRYKSDHIDIIRKNYAEAYFYIADDKLESNNFEEAKSYYKKSFEINKNLLPQIKNKLESQQYSSFLLGLSSIIPGLGQFIQGDSKSGFTHLGLFGGSIIAGFILKTVADNDYNNYNGATSKAEATRLYDSANKKLNYSYALFGFGSAVIIYSIIDSFIKAENFNKNYELNLDTFSQYPIHSNDYVNISLKLYF